jgi:hypothetical protein
MDVAQLIGRYLRLREELAGVFKARPLQVDRATRLAKDLRSTRVAMFEAKGGDEQTGDSLTFAASVFLLPPSGFDEGPEWPGTTRGAPRSLRRTRSVLLPPQSYES